jgi:hypothetical protein
MVTERRPPSTRTARAVRGCAKWTADEYHHGRDFIGCREPFQQAKSGAPFRRILFRPAVEFDRLATRAEPTNSSTPSDAVGPGKTALHVTPVPAHVSAMPRATAICAVFVTP